MANTIIENIREKLNLEEFHFIDPNTEKVESDKNDYPINRLQQGTITAILAGFLNTNSHEKEFEKLMNSSSANEAIQTIFEGKSQEVIQQIAEYAHVEKQKVESIFEKYAQAVLEAVKSNLTGENHILNASQNLAAEKERILKYLSAQLKMGNILSDDTYDDVTNKMRGPFSGVSNAIENLFNNDISKEEADRIHDESRRTE